MPVLPVRVIQATRVTGDTREIFCFYFRLGNYNNRFDFRVILNITAFIVVGMYVHCESDYESI